MVEVRRNEYRPDYVSAPGETLLDILEERGMSQADLAERTGRPLKTINEIIKGKTALTPDTSIQLERVLGVNAEFWNQREAYYRAYIARKKEIEDLGAHAEWLKQFPIHEMIKRKWMADPGKEKTSRIISLLNYFSVASPEQWTEGWTQHKLAFRKSMKLSVKHGPTAVWLRQGEIDAEKIECAPYSREKLLATLPELRKLTMERNPEIFIPKLQKLCAEAGVALVFVMPFVGVPIFGASKWLNPNKAMIQLSARGKTDDLLWFTIFHELNHILHHSKKEMFVEFTKKDEARGPEEEEADNLAAEQLLPKADFEKWISGRFNIGADDVIEFAKKQQIAPGIVVGRMQHVSLINYSSPLSKLKVRYQWKD